MKMTRKFMKFERDDYFIELGILQGKREEQQEALKKLKLIQNQFVKNSEYWKLLKLVIKNFKEK